MLRSVDEVIKKLGGTTAVASLAGVSAPAVSNWRERKRIPQANFLIVRDALARFGEEADPKVFGFKREVRA